jgi:hypothetical protein
VLTVQSILGHKFIDTTLGYARLYDGTVAADYYRAMAEIESQHDGGIAPVPPGSGQLLALVDSLHTGTLNDALNARLCRRCARASWPWPKAATEPDRPGQKLLDVCSSPCYPARTQGKAGEDSRGSGCSLPFSLSSRLCR